MKKQFYSHLITLETVRIELEELNLTDKEQEDLLQLAQSHIHYVMIETALNHIPEKDKKVFLQYLVEEDHQKTWTLLRSNAKDIEKYLLHAVHTLYEQLREDIRELPKTAKK